ncbi:MAG: ESX secretion-associated protein EspG, partial [Pseudonocardiales bacterium]|nr:ESX secretion-associated protein EspG [Pseudonocardiales bacterium]
ATQQMADLLHAPRRAMAQIYAELRDRHGRRTESHYPMAIVETADTVWIVAPQIERGQRWMLATPATHAATRHVLARLLDDLAPADRNLR